MTMETNSAQAADLASYELIGGGWQRSQQFIDMIRLVKPADVVTAAKKYMTNFRFVVVGDPNSIDRKVFIP
jgi:predicted Zn-dependent peptidase